MPDADLRKIVNKDIELIYRPWEEKEENLRWKEERKAREKAEKEAERLHQSSLFNDAWVKIWDAPAEPEEPEEIEEEVNEEIEENIEDAENSEE